MPRIIEVVPTKSFFKPGEQVSVEVTIASEGAARTNCVMRLVHIGDVVACQERAVPLETTACERSIFSCSVPREAPRGYGIEVDLLDELGAVTSTASSAIDVLERWSQAPRYGFLSTFSPERTREEVEQAVRSLRRFHINIVQFYDWMWRHYRLLPPADQFTDALGRELSLPVVRQTIEAVQESGSAAFAYGAVYGAEPEYADTHPELVLHDRDGKRISLAELFYIMDIAPESPWTALMIDEFAETIRELDFDGIHMDQYGFPKEISWNGAGARRDLSEDFPPMIDAARAAVVAEKPDAGVIFNLVDNWPVETVAPTTQDAIYIEVWPPYDTYLDLFQLIENAKRLGRGQQVILAAYLTPFLAAPNAPESEAAALLATAVIASSGGFHLLLGETNGVLCDPYYPKFATIRESFLSRLAAYYDHLVRYEEWLTARDVTAWNVRIDGRGISLQPEAGKIWAIPRQSASHHVIHLIDLRDQSDIRWNAPRHSWSKDRTEPVQLRVQIVEPLASACFVSPDYDHGRLTPCSSLWDDGVQTVGLTIPGPWTSIVFETPER